MQINLLNRPNVSFKCWSVHFLILPVSGLADLNKDLVCLRSSGVFLLMFSFISLMSISLGVSICFCLRIRGMKHLQRNLQSVRNFGSEFSVSRCSSSDCSVFSDKHRNLFARLRWASSSSVVSRVDQPTPHHPHRYEMDFTSQNHTFSLDLFGNSLNKWANGKDKLRIHKQAFTLTIIDCDIYLFIFQK